MEPTLNSDEAVAAVLQSSESEKDSTSNEEGEEYLPGNEELCSSSEEEKEEETKMELDSQWRSKNGEILWCPTHEETLRFFPASILTPGPTHYATARISSPVSAFDLLFAEDLMQLIRHFTNLQGKRSVKQWKDVGEEELRAYMGLLILAGLYRSQHEATESLWDGVTGRVIFPATMSRKRFQQINLALRFDDHLSRPGCRRENKMGPIKDLWSKWSSRLPTFFNPGREICVDEQLVPFRGRCSFKQYMRLKPAKYGLKIWALCDVQTSYAWRLQIYTGKSASAKREVSQGMQVVLDLTDGLKGHTVTMDNFFTSFPLAEELRKRKMALVGTLRINKPELPPQLLNIQHREVMSSVFAFSRNAALVSYVPKKSRNVLLLSTKHREPQVENSGKKKPQIILDYNKCKGAVDHLDQVCGTYSCRRRTRRWPMCLLYHMIDVSCYNAFVLFTAVDTEWNKGKRYCRRLFIEQVGRALITPTMMNRSHLPRTPFAVSLVLQAQGKEQQEQQEKEEEQQEEEEEQQEEEWESPSKKRKQCASCKQRKRIITNCCKCGAPACKIHLKTLCGSCYKM
ncbi:piggyBac transposable element-derived protein 4-like [Oreochromis aureus]|uniref:piggyBac transposable element-derived protein 4-like n=1 Tax=Oreochromis aureus TaxID=47969 RepID=UPI001953B491|nr:piggyBac transposable element-derived protein 4-like [Oreochromis aureus]